jgi:hypothetical protein
MRLRKGVNYVQKKASGFHPRFFFDMVLSSTVGIAAIRVMISNTLAHDHPCSCGRTYSNKFAYSHFSQEQSQAAARSGSQELYQDKVVQSLLNDASESAILELSDLEEVDDLDVEVCASFQTMCTVLCSF